MNTPLERGPAEEATVPTRRRRSPRRWMIAAALLLVIAGAGCADGAADSVTATDGVPCDAEPEVMTTDEGVDFVRTPDSCFEDLPGWPYESQYIEIDGLRQAYVDEGPADGEVVLLLHGQPSWSYLYRDMIPVLTDAGYRVIAMDHLGMGRSDKPTDIESYSYVGHSDRLETFIDELGLTDINLFVQDWGSLIGLKVAGENPDLFATIAVGDGNLLPVPEGLEPFPPVENPNEIVDIPSPFAGIPAQQVPFYDGCELIAGPGEGYFGDWMVYAMTAESFQASEVVEAMTWFDLTPEEEAAYDAPFPSRTYMAGPRSFPSLANELGGNTAAAWAGLTSHDKPFLTLWASNDPGQLGSCEAQQRLVDNVPGAEGQPHDRLPEASHFLQDDQGTEIATRLVEWYSSLEGDASGTGPDPTEASAAGGDTKAASVSANDAEERVGFEILEVIADGTIRAWIATDMTQEEFDGLELPAGWLKNQPREGQPDTSRFFGSPGADGVLVEEVHFGYVWFHSATITSTGDYLDDEGLLRATTVEKDHEISFEPGSSLSLLISPEGSTHVMVTRDAGRTTDDPTLPAGWQIVTQVVPDGYTARLDGETQVIRMDNEDSYQGPITGLDPATSTAAPAFDPLTESGFTDPGLEAGASPAILSAYLGAVDLPAFLVGPLEDISGCEQAPLDEGLPVVLSHPVDVSTLDTADFVVTTAAGNTATPTCATLKPATEDDELQSVLLTGPLGTGGDRPVRVSIVGELLATDGTDLTGLEIDDLNTHEDGPEIVLARLDPAGETCASLGSTHEIQTTWQGGVTGPRGTEPGAVELEGFALVDVDGKAHALVGFDDLGDGDNYVVVCVPPEVEPATLEVRPKTLFDPTNNPNPATSAAVDPRSQPR